MSKFYSSGLSDNVIDAASSQNCGEFAVVLYTELKNAGLDVSYGIVTPDDGKGGWTHAFVHDNKKKNYIDVEGWDNGDHILDHDIYFEAFDEHELSDGQEIILEVLPDSKARFIMSADDMKQVLKQDTPITRGARTLAAKYIKTS